MNKNIRTEKYNEWLAHCPEFFPEFIDAVPANHNPIIGISQMDTLDNIFHVISVLQDMFLFPHDPNNSVEFDTQSTSGMGCILGCLMEALQFEMKHRPNGGEKIEE